VSPETIDGFVNAWLWAADKADTYGPGVTAAAIAWAGWWALCRAADYRARRRWIAADISAIEGLEQLEAELEATWQRLQNEAREEKP
jgi:hypothetical protein